MSRTWWWTLTLALSGCKGWLDVPPPGQLFQVAGFEDATAALGYQVVGPSFGMGWGDVNGDALPDLWAGNHALAPALFVNQGDGTFSEQVDSWVEPTFERIYDAHGVAWADLDNDGDADLIESVGAQQGEGQGRNRVHLNLGGGLEDVGTINGLGHPSASGRCPIPNDWNRDGRVDVVLVAQPKGDMSFPTAMFTQQPDGSFVLTGEVPAELAHPTALCGGLVDVDGDFQAEIVAFGRPGGLSAYDGRSGELVDVSQAVGLPLPPLFPFDVVMADFDNDLDNDIYLTRWNEVSATRVDEAGGYAALALRVQDGSQGIRFRTEGEVTISLDPAGFWFADQIHVGGDCSGVDVLDTAMRVVTRSDAPDVQGLCPFQSGVDAGLYVGVQEGVFEIRLAAGEWNRGNIEVRSTAPLIDAALLDVTSLSIDDERQYNRDRLFFRSNDHFEDVGWNHGIQELTTCTSVAAGDFDNDADLDLYLVCASPVENTADLVYLNQGGNFLLTEVPGTRGATAGRGDSVAVADYDQDGFLDLAVSNGYGALPFNQGPLQLLHNRGNGNHWLEIDLVGTASTRDAWGAVVIVRAGDVAQRREAGGTHAMAQHHQRLHVGLGGATTVQEIEVYWPTGQMQVVEGVAVDQIIEIREP